MTKEELISCLEELESLKTMKEDLDSTIEGLQDKIKAHMTETDADTLILEKYNVSYKPYTSTRIDTKKLHEDLPEVWDEYGKEVTAKRFLVKIKG